MRERVCSPWLKSLFVVDVDDNYDELLMSLFVTNEFLVVYDTFSNAVKRLSIVFSWSVSCLFSAKAVIINTLLHRFLFHFGD